MSGNRHHPGMVLLSSLAVLLLIWLMARSGASGLALVARSEAAQVSERRLAQVLRSQLNPGPFHGVGDRACKTLNGEQICWRAVTRSLDAHGDIWIEVVCERGAKTVCFGAVGQLGYAWIFLPQP